MIVPTSKIIELVSPATLVWILLSLRSSLSIPWSPVLFRSFESCLLILKNVSELFFLFHHSFFLLVDFIDAHLLRADIEALWDFLHSLLNFRIFTKFHKIFVCQWLIAYFFHQVIEARQKFVELFDLFVRKIIWVECFFSQIVLVIKHIQLLCFSSKLHILLVFVQQIIFWLFFRNCPQFFFELYVLIKHIHHILGSLWLIPEVCILIYLFF